MLESVWFDKASEIMIDYIEEKNLTLPQSEVDAYGYGYESVMEAICGGFKDHNLMSLEDEIISLQPFPAEDYYAGYVGPDLIKYGKFGRWSLSDFKEALSMYVTTSLNPVVSH